MRVFYNKRNPYEKNKRFINTTGVAKRTCLRCKKTFTSHSAGNRICDGCKKSPEFKQAMSDPHDYI